MKKNKRINKGVVFLAIISSLYIFMFAFDTAKTKAAFLFSVHIFIRIIPVLIIILIIMWLLNRLQPGKIAQYIGEKSGFKGWLIAMAGGILSHGPIHVWYPVLKQLQEKGMKQKFTAVFLYCRSIKIPLLPMMIFYFGLTFTIIFNLYLMIASIILGLIMDYLSLNQKG